MKTARDEMTNEIESLNVKIITQQEEHAAAEQELANLRPTVDRLVTELKWFREANATLNAELGSHPAERTQER
jgi:septal ring factor EnvC (AmiA/AmiB activator)